MDLPSASNPHKPLKRHVIGQEVLSTITKAFLETVYAFLDGLVHLASEESPVSHRHQAVVIDMGIAPGSNPLELLDLTETVSFLGIRTQPVLTFWQENRILLVVSNFGCLSNKFVPTMMTELEGSLNVSLTNDRQVRGMGRILVPRLTHRPPRPSQKSSKSLTRPFSIVTSSPSPASSLQLCGMVYSVVRWIGTRHLNQKVTGDIYDHL
jgi:hypothetical protein